MVSSGFGPKWIAKRWYRTRAHQALPRWWALGILLWAFGADTFAQSTIKLNPPLVAGGNITLHKATPDGSRVVYRADQDVDEEFSLYSVRLDTPGTAVKLNGKLPKGGSVHPTYGFLPGGEHVYYLADQDTLGVLEIYVVDIEGQTPPLKLNGPLAQGQAVDPFSFGISADGNWVVYMVGQVGADPVEVYSRRTDGSGVAEQLNSPTFAGGDIRSFKLSPDSNWVVYRGVQDIEFRDELYSVPIDGSGAPLKLNGELVTGGDVDFFFSIAPDSSRVVFRADVEVDQKLELYSRRLNGSGQPDKLNEPLASDESEVGGFRILADSATVVYTAEQDDADKLELYRTTLDGAGAAQKLSAPLVEGGNAFIDDVTPDGTQVIYLADQNTDGVQEAFVVSTDASSPPLRLNVDPPLETSVIGGQANCDGSSYIYFGDLITPDFVDIYSSSLDGARVGTQLNGPPSVNNIGAFGLSGDAQFVVYLAGSIFRGVGLYGVRQTGGTTTRISPPLPEDGSIMGLTEILNDHRTVIYRAEQDDSDTTELYLSRITLFDDGFELNPCAGSAPVSRSRVAPAP